MSLVIRQRILSLTDAYDICDESGEARYSVWTEFFTLGHRIHVIDVKTGLEAGRINEKTFTFLHRAVVESRVETFEIVRELSFFKPRYSVSNGWSIAGNFTGWDYEIKDDLGRTVASVSKEIFRFSDTYTLSCEDPSNELTALLCAITIDMMNCGNN